MASPFDPIVNSVKEYGVLGSLLTPLFGPPGKSTAQLAIDQQRKSVPLMQKAAEMAQRNPNARPDQLLKMLLSDPNNSDAIMDAAKSPEDISKIVSDLAAPQQEAFTLGENDMRFGAAPIGQPPPVIAKGAPKMSDATRTMNEFMAELGITGPERQKYIAGKLQTLAFGDKTQQEQAWANILRSRPDLADMAEHDLAGAIKQVPIYNNQGIIVGAKLVDLITNKEYYSSLGGNSQMQQAPGAPIGVPGQQGGPPTTIAPPMQASPYGQPYTPLLGDVNIPSAYKETVANMEQRYPKIPSGLLPRVWQAESSWDPKIVSPKGNIGIGQLGAGVIKDYNVTDPTDPQQNMQASAAYLNDLITKYQNPGHALMAYNWGPGNFEKWDGDPTKVPGETVGYLIKILGSEDAVETLTKGLTDDIKYSGPARPKPLETLPIPEAVFGVGPMPAAARFINFLAASVNANWAIDRPAQQAQKAFANLEKLSIDYFDRGEQTNLREMEIARKNIPGTSMWDHTSSAIDSLVALRELVWTRMQSDLGVATDVGNQFADTRKDALEKIKLGALVLQMIGPPQELEAANAKWKSQYPAQDLWQVFNRAVFGQGSVIPGREPNWGAVPGAPTAPTGGPPPPAGAAPAPVAPQPSTPAQPLPVPPQLTPDVRGQMPVGTQGQTAAQAAAQPPVPDQPVSKDPASPNYEGYAPIWQVAVSFNDRVAELLSVPPELVMEAARRVGAKSIQGNRPPERGAFKAALVREMNAMGVPTQKIQNAWGDLGAAGMDTLWQSALFFYAAPYMLAKGVQTLGGRILNSIGRGITERPTQFTVSELGANVGAQVAERKTGGSPLGTMAGATIGGMTAGGAIGLVRRGGTTAGRIFFPGKFKPKLEGTSIEQSLDDPAVAQQWLDQLVESETTGIKNTIQKAITDVDAGLPGAQARLRQSIRSARVKERQIEKTMWDAVDLRATSPTDHLRNIALGMKEELLTQPGGAPFAKLKTVGGRGYISEKQVNLVEHILSKRFRKPMSVGNLLDLRSQIRAARLEMEGMQGGGNAAAIRNYNILEDAVLQQIEDGTTGNMAVKQALAISREFNSLFRQGPIGQILARQRGQGEPKVPYNQTAEKLMNIPGGMESVVRLGRPESVTKAAQDAVRQMFREEAGDAPSALKWIKDHSKDVEALTKVHSELEDTGRVIQEAVNAENKLTSSAVFKMSKMDPQTLIDRVWTNPNPAQIAKELVPALAKNPRALAGWQQGHIRKLLSKASDKDGNIDVVKVGQLLKDPKIDRMLQVAFRNNPERYERIYRLVDISNAILRGDEKSARSMAMKTPGIRALVVTGRVAGSWLFRKAGLHTIQATQQGANVGESVLRKIWTRFMGNVLMQPDELFARALTDPRYERLLLMRAPADTRSLRVASARARKTASALATMSALGDAE